ncbi:Uncharacterized conserved protein [Phaffia rhodozyma]|uniref:Glycerophosphocholine acyltransferase 1 n=1 Tax=Phaffia rhodozyma TaxID=264483 RepID=A0A0F7SEQ4_PHARH|nr:Uncharacterized conserved protein [Phaffia rhodozyma]
MRTDVLETFFDSRLDLIERQLKVHKDRLKYKAGEVLSKSSANLRALAPKSPRIWPSDRPEGDEDFTDRGISRARSDSLEEAAATEHARKGMKKEERWLLAEKELRKFKDKTQDRLQSLSTSWESARHLRTRDKVSFFFGVMTVLTSCLMVGLYPEWIPLWYTIQSAFYLPVRIWTYKKKQWHYFLWDMCYYVNVLDLIWMWFFPANTIFFTACYLLTMGPLASAIITWRNSLVFHSLDKVTSLFIHIYPPLTLTTIIHFYPNGAERWPGIVRSGEIAWWRKMVLGIGFYLVWQMMYWRFVVIGRREKINAGRITSFSTLLKDKHNVIGRWMRATKPEKRESLFMFWQLVYTAVCFLPPIFFLWKSKVGSGVFLITVFAVATWNGASYYVEVWGRKFERELEALRKEMATLTTSSSPAMSQADLPFSETSSVGLSSAMATTSHDVSSTAEKRPGLTQVPSFSLDENSEKSEGALDKVDRKLRDHGAEIGGG